MNLDKSLLSKMLNRALCNGAEFAEIYVQESSGLGFEVEETKIRSSSCAVSA